MFIWIDKSLIYEPLHLSQKNDASKVAQETAMKLLQVRNKFPLNETAKVSFS